MRDPLLRLADVRDAIARLRRHCAVTPSDFMSDEVLQDHAMRQLEIIGEAVRNVPEEWLDRHPEIPWRRVIGARNFISHVDFAVNLDTIWEILTTDLDPLEAAIDELIQWRSGSAS